MHERERHRMILSAIRGRPVGTVQEFSALTGASEATIRRDIQALANARRLRKVRGGAEALISPPPGLPGGSNFAEAQTRRIPEKQAIAREAAKLCEDDDAAILNGGSTTFQMVHFLTNASLQVMTNSFPIADHLLQHSRCTVFLPAGSIYRAQGLILSPFEADGTAHFRARRMFMGVQSVSALGFAETDPLIIQSEQRLMRQADELVILADSSKFSNRSSLLLAPLERAHVLVTDEGVADADAAMIEAAGLRLVIAKTDQGGSNAAG